MGQMGAETDRDRCVWKGAGGVEEVQNGVVVVNWVFEVMCKARRWSKASVFEPNLCSASNSNTLIPLVKQKK